MQSVISEINLLNLLDLQLFPYRILNVLLIVEWSVRVGHVSYLGRHCDFVGNLHLLRRAKGRIAEVDGLIQQVLVWIALQVGELPNHVMDFRSLRTRSDVYAQIIVEHFLKFALSVCVHHVGFVGFVIILIHIHLRALSGDAVSTAASFL